MDLDKFKLEKAQAKALYQAQKFVYNPYFKKNIRLTAKGFHHLEFTSGRKRSENEQLFKFRFLDMALEILRTSTTVQEYRVMYSPGGKITEYWGMVAIVGKNNFKIRVVLRKIGKGQTSFWSVMPYSKINKGRQKLYDEAMLEI